MYYLKYLKYKNKYLELKNSIVGGVDDEVFKGFDKDDEGFDNDDEVFKGFDGEDDKKLLERLKFLDNYPNNDIIKRCSYDSKTNTGKATINRIDKESDITYIKNNDNSVSISGIDDWGSFEDKINQSTLNDIVINELNDRCKRTAILDASCRQEFNLENLAEIDLNNKCKEMMQKNKEASLRYSEERHRKIIEDFNRDIKEINKKNTGRRGHNRRKGRR